MRIAAVRLPTTKVCFEVWSAAAEAAEVAVVAVVAVAAVAGVAAEVA